MGNEKLPKLCDPSLWENGINAAMLSYNVNDITVKAPTGKMTVFMLLLMAYEFRSMAVTRYR